MPTNTGANSGMPISTSSGFGASANDQDHSTAPDGGTTSDNHTIFTIAQGLRGIWVREAMYTTHADYLRDIAERPTVELATMQGTFHCQALEMLRRAIRFHAMRLAVYDGQQQGRGPVAGALVEKATKFIDAGKDVDVHGDGSEFRISPGQLLRLKLIVNCLKVDRVCGAVEWIEDHDIARIALRMNPTHLGDQKSCANCGLMFGGVVINNGSANLEQKAEKPHGLLSCEHILCKKCVHNWVHDSKARGVPGTQPCCARAAG